MNDDDSRRRRHLISLGELIGLGALIVSGFGVWLSWKSSGEDKPTRIVEQRQAIPLTLRAKAMEDGGKLQISPVESGHALDSLSVKIAGESIEVGSDGELAAGDVQSALGDRDKEPKERTLSVPVRITARYVEAGTDRTGGGSYRLRYRWEGGGLFGGRSLKLVGLSRG